MEIKLSSPKKDEFKKILNVFATRYGFDLNSDECNTILLSIDAMETYLSKNDFDRYMESFIDLKKSYKILEATYRIEDSNNLFKSRLVSLIMELKFKKVLDIKPRFYKKMLQKSVTGCYCNYHSLFSAQRLQKLQNKEQHAENEVLNYFDSFSKYFDINCDLHNDFLSQPLKTRYEGKKPLKKSNMCKINTCPV